MTRILVLVLARGNKGVEKTEYFRKHGKPTSLPAITTNFLILSFVSEGSQILFALKKFNYIFYLIAPKDLEPI